MTPTPRASFTAALLADGSVLMTGGDWGALALASAESAHGRAAHLTAALGPSPATHTEFSDYRWFVYSHVFI